MEAETEKELESYEAMARTTKISATQQKILCVVSQRDEVCYSLRLKEDAKGQDVMNEVCDKLGIVEKDYFGLQYTNSRGEIHWLNMRNRVSRQLNKPEPYSLLFCVKFYVPPHQLLQESSRKQFFLNVKHDLLVGKYHVPENYLARLYGLLSQAEAGNFRENHISYNPSRSLLWSPEFRSNIILEHCKLKGMTPEEAEFYCLKEVSELKDYGMNYHNVRSEDNNKAVHFGIGIDCLMVERANEVIQRVPYTCLRMATHSGKTVKLDIYTSEVGDIDSVVYRLSSKEAACALYRSITEHHAFYRCDSVRPAVKEQVARDFFDSILSWFHDDNNEQNYIFDTERTCREAYDYARRILYNFGTSAASAMTFPGDSDKIHENCNISDEPEMLQRRVNVLTQKIYSVKESFHCPVCCDQVVDIVIQCGHLICSCCSELCQSCPLCRAEVITKTKFYLPLNMTCLDKDDTVPHCVVSSQINLAKFESSSDSTIHADRTETGLYGQGILLE